jgi:phosphoglycerol transferase MdoB-like AlkP superfamily enzyme
MAWVIWKFVLKKNRLQTTFQTWKRQILFALSYLVIFGATFVLMIRGGVQQIPVSATNAYHSKKQIVNDVTVNPVWNFIHVSYVHFKVDLAEYFQNIPPNEAEKMRLELYENDPGADTVRVFNHQQPNLIFVIMESWSAQVIGPLGGEPGVTPNFNALCDEGLLFTELYATGGTSETGISSIMSGYPTISGISISSESAKCRQLPAINKVLAEKGYESLFAFGGSLSYGNIGGYLTDIGVDRIIDEDDLDLEPSGKLGIHDEAMFPYFFEQVEKAKRPYFYSLFTQSTHAPYDMPAEPFGDYDDPYLTSMHYADEHLGIFIEKLRALPDFDNTLVVFLADHGRTNRFNGDTYDQKYFHIPLLFWGGALKKSYAGQKINKIGSQADLAKTLLNQMGLDTKAFHWSKNLLNPTTKAWAVCTSTLSYGWKNEDGYTVYHMIDGRMVHTPYESEKLTKEALNKSRAILESMYREYVEF